LQEQQDKIMASFKTILRSRYKCYAFLEHRMENYGESSADPANEEMKIYQGAGSLVQG